MKVFKGDLVMEKKKRIRKYKIGLLIEVAIFFFVSIVLTGHLSHIVLSHIADRSVEVDKEILSEGIAKDVKYSLRQYPCYDWVIAYWIEHMDEMDVEYDKNIDTAVKEKDFLKNHSDIVFDTVNDYELNKLSPEDKKAFAEIMYNKILMRLEDIKDAYEVKYVYFFYTEGDASTMTNLVSAADSSVARGNTKGQAFLLGTTIENSAKQQMAFQKIKGKGDHLVITNENVNRYHYFTTISGKTIIIGVSFDISIIKGEVEDRMLVYVILFLFLQFFFSAICLFLINIFALRPLRHVKENMDEYTETKESEKVLKQLKKIRSRNEIGALANGLGDMIIEIDDHLEKIKNITAENERINAELNIATQIQADMLPREFPAFPDHPEIDVYATMDPAKQVGGDFYDFFMVDENHVALIVADVTGKGVPAALFMVVAKTLLRNRTLLGGRPAEILNDVNNQLREGNEANLFVTVWIAMIDIRTGEGVAANAGHEHPVIRHKNGEYELVMYKHSMVLGVMEGLKYADHEFKLEPGDRIFCYSDGVPEATNMENELYGTDRMLDALNHSPDADLQQTLTDVRTDIDRFVGEEEQFDDITMLIFDYKNK